MENSGSAIVMVLRLVPPETCEQASLDGPAATGRPVEPCFRVRWGGYIAGFRPYARKMGRIREAPPPIGSAPGWFQRQSGGHRHLNQAQVPGHRPKIAVMMEQRAAVLDAPSADQQVDGFADGDTAPTQKAKITRRRNRNRLSDHRHHREFAQHRLDLFGFSLSIHTLEDLAQHQVSDEDFLPTQRRLQSTDMSQAAAVEEIDPDAAVDNDQMDARPLRLRSRFPRQRNLPNAAPASCWRFNLTIKRSASSTVCFLVASPEAFCASAISLSSMSILVRMSATSANVYKTGI